MGIPAIVILRDRVTYAQECAGVLASEGLDVHVVDHGSTWPAAVEWLADCGLPVHCRSNGHPRSIWSWGGLRAIVGTGRYVVTDPDVIPDGPAGWLDRLNDLLDQYPDRVKAGLGLRIDDLPACYRHSEAVRAWEAQWWATEMSPGVFDAPVDTTLALYRSLDEVQGFDLGPALRTGFPYVARHLAWYEDSDAPTDEVAHYLANVAPKVSHWADPELYVGAK